MDLFDFLQALLELPRFVIPTPAQCRAWMRQTEGGSVFLLPSAAGGLSIAQQLWIYRDVQSDSREIEHHHAR